MGIENPSEKLAETVFVLNSKCNQKEELEVWSIVGPGSHFIDDPNSWAMKILLENWRKLFSSRIQNVTKRKN